MGIFDYNNYKQWVLAELKQRPKKGRGEFLKISKALNVHTTMITHVFRGDHHLSPEQALALTEYFCLKPLETEYFLGMVHVARAADQRTRRFYQSKLREIKDKSLSLTTRLELKNKLDESDQAIFYSFWYYSAIRLMSANPRLGNPSVLAAELGLTLYEVNEAIEFLVSRGLVTKNGSQIS
jgi:uncharacterized protein (TIGR02147 family)